MSLRDLGPGTHVGNYVVEGVVGRGGLATVYRVRHRELGSLHALKVVPMSAKRMRDRLLTEGRVQADVRHPNLVPVTDVVEVDGTPALVLELVRGPSLDRVLAERRLTLKQVDLLARGILAGVAAAHRQGILHRDLKPANVLVQVDADGLTPKVADFGLAKVLDPDGSQSRTRSGVSLGTPAYMAPEQIRNAKHVDHRADVFSLGAMLYEMLTGEQAFNAPDAFGAWKLIQAGQYRPPRELVPHVPDRMERAIQAALVTDPEQRCPSVEQLLQLWEGSRSKHRPGEVPERVASSVATLRALAADLEKSMGATWQPGPEHALEEQNTLRETGVATLDIAPLPIEYDGPPADNDDVGDTTVLYRLRRDYGIFAAITAVVVSMLGVVAVGLLVILLAVQLMGPDDEVPVGPSLEQALPAE